MCFFDLLYNRFGLIRRGKLILQLLVSLGNVFLNILRSGKLCGYFRGLVRVFSHSLFLSACRRARH